LFTVLCIVLLCVTSCCVVCAQSFLCLWSVYSLFFLRVPLTSIYFPYTIIMIIRLFYGSSCRHILCYYIYMRALLAHISTWSISDKLLRCSSLISRLFPDHHVMLQCKMSDIITFLFYFKRHIFFWCDSIVVFLSYCIRKLFCYE